jgi:hypothetical protein
MKMIRLLIAVAALGLVLAGCETGSDLIGPSPEKAPAVGQDKNGSEQLGDPGILATGSGLAYAGVGMVTQPATLSIDVPGTAINQVLLYWSGGTDQEPYTGDDTITFAGESITGELIGGPTLFYGAYRFTAYRADITDRGLVNLGPNSIQVQDMVYPFNNTSENNGVGLLVVYDDGTARNLQLRDGLDLAFFNFAGDLQVTVPQSFTFDPLSTDTTADLIIFAGSVHENRPNRITVTIDGSTQVFDDYLASNQGPQWDAALISPTIPAGATELTVQVISTPSSNPLGASLSWVTAALAVNVEEEELGAIGDFVWYDTNQDGAQDVGEMGIPDITVHLFDCDDNLLATASTAASGEYLFDGLPEGDYYVHFVLPPGLMFSPQDATDDALDSDADPTTGRTICTHLDPGEIDRTWDAGMYEPVQEGCTRTKGYWMNHSGQGNGNQDDEVTPLLPIWLGDAGGAESVQVTTNVMAHQILDRRFCSSRNNGVGKLYAQLLAAKLNFASGASPDAVTDVVFDADAWLADHGCGDWGDDVSDMVLGWKDTLDDYNNGRIGPGHCDDMDDDSGTCLDRK